MIKRLSLLLLFVCSTANAQFVTGQILTAQQLNNAFANVLTLTGGTLTGPLTVPTMTVTGNLTVNGTFTASGAISPASLAPQVPNSLIGNVSNNTQSPGVVGLPSCNSSTNALNYANGAGFVCNTNINASTLGGQIFAAPGPIGSQVASTGAFTTLSASSTVSGAGFTTLLSPYALLASPTFTGTPAAPTATTGTNTTQLATTAFVNSSITAAAGSLLNVQVFSSGGTYTPTAGTTKILVRVQGAGGAGGGTSATASTTVAAASGGGAGAYAQGLITSGFSGATITVGTGGTGVSGASGNAGGTSSFGALISAPGGTGGGLSGAAVPPFITSSGANSSLATGASIVNGNGAAGGNGLALSTAILQSGIGAASLFGPGGISRVNTTSAGQAGGNPGAGGSGAIALTSQAAQTGGAGANGVVIVYEYK